MIIEIESKEDLESRIQSAPAKLLVVVEFYAPWCGSCKMVEARVHELAEEHDKVPFLKVNVDELEDLAVENNVSAMPTFLLWKDKKLVGQFTGTKLERLIESIIKNK